MESAPRRRGDTRVRLLETALQLFAERGYAGTSVRDIADELGITKAAVHYHFAAKEQIVAALLAPLVEQIQERLDRATGGPRALLLELRDLLTGFGSLLSVLIADPSMAHAAGPLRDELDALGVRSAQALAGPGAGPERLLRAHCALAAFVGGWNVAYRSGSGVVAPADLDVLLDAALGALGPQRR